MESSKNKNIDVDSEANDEKEAKFLKGGGVLKKLSSLIIFLLIIFLIGLLLLEKIITFKDTANNLNNDFRKIIEANFAGAAEEKTRAVIGGTIKFKSYPKPYILVNDIRIENFIQRDYRINYKISKIKLHVSLKDLLRKNLVVSKVEIIDGNADIFQLNEENESFAIKVIQEYIKSALKEKNNLNIFFNNNNLIVSSRNYVKNFSSISLNLNFSNKKTSIKGNFLSDKHPTNIDLTIDSKADSSIISARLSSQAFEYKINIDEKNSFKEFSGTSSFNLVNLQLFVRTFFSSVNLPYKRIIDNSFLNGSFSFAFKDGSFNATKIVLDGKNIAGGGNININLNEQQPNNFNFNIANINLDELIVKDISSNKKVNIDDIQILKDNNLNNIASQISIVSDVKNGFLNDIFNKNITIFHINIKNAKFNDRVLTDSDLNFSYSNVNRINFEKISVNLPGETSLNVLGNSINISGKNFDEFSNFLRNKTAFSNGTYAARSPVQTENKEGQNNVDNSFVFSGIVRFDNNKIFVNNSNFSYKTLKTNGDIEILFDSGVNYLAVNAKIDELILNNFLRIKEINNSNYTLDDMFKNKILFLNNYTLNTILKLNINKLKYDDISINNSSFVIRTSQGFLELSNINLDDKMKGVFGIDIRGKNPLFNSQLTINNFVFEKNFDLIKSLFYIPYFDDIHGKIIVDISNLKFKEATIENFQINTTINNGLVRIENMNLNGFGGSCKLNGFVDLKFNKKLNLTFEGCTSSLENSLYLFTGNKNVSGIFGFSSLLYSEGTNLENFMSNYIFKTQFVGNGISVDGFGLTNLSSSLFAIQEDRALLNRINPNDILLNPNNKTIFEKISGTVEYSGKNKEGVFLIDTVMPTINGKVTGKFDFYTNYLKIIDMQSNFILLSGTLAKTVPLNLVIKTSGNTNERLNSVVNYQQINEYIDSTRELFRQFDLENSNNSQ